MYEEFEEGYVRDRDGRGRSDERDDRDGGEPRQEPPRRGGIGKVILIVILVIVLVGAGFAGAVFLMGSRGSGRQQQAEQAAQQQQQAAPADESANSGKTTGETVGSDNPALEKQQVKSLEGRVKGGSNWGWGGATEPERKRVLERAHAAVGKKWELGGEMALLRECWGPEGVEFPGSLGGEGRGWGLFDELRESLAGVVLEAKYVSAGDILIIGDVVSEKSVNVATAGIYVGGGEMICCLSPEVAEAAGLDSGVVLVDVDSAGGYVLVSSPLR